jgi:hypothetical protein
MAERQTLLSSVNPGVRVQGVQGNVPDMGIAARAIGAAGQQIGQVGYQIGERAAEQQAQRRAQYEAALKQQAAQVQKQLQYDAMVDAQKRQASDDALNADGPTALKMSDQYRKDWLDKGQALASSDEYKNNPYVAQMLSEGEIGDNLFHNMAAFVTSSVSKDVGAKQFAAARNTEALAAGNFAGMIPNNPGYATGDPEWYGQAFDSINIGNLDRPEGLQQGSPLYDFQKAYNDKIISREQMYRGAAGQGTILFSAAMNKAMTGAYTPGQVEKINEVAARKGAWTGNQQRELYNSAVSAQKRLKVGVDDSPQAIARSNVYRETIADGDNKRDLGYEAGIRSQVEALMEKGKTFDASRLWAGLQSAISMNSLMSTVKDNNGVPWQQSEWTDKMVEYADLGKISADNAQELLNAEARKNGEPVMDYHAAGYTDEEIKGFLKPLQDYAIKYNKALENGTWDEDIGNRWRSSASTRANPNTQAVNNAIATGQGIDIAGKQATQYRKDNYLNTKAQQDASGVAEKDQRQVNPFDVAALTSPRTNLSNMIEKFKYLAGGTRMTGQYGTDTWQLAQVAAKQGMASNNPAVQNNMGILLPLMAYSQQPNEELRGQGHLGDVMATYAQRASSVQPADLTQYRGLVDRITGRTGVENAINGRAQFLFKGALGYKSYEQTGDEYTYQAVRAAFANGDGSEEWGRNSAPLVQALDRFADVWITGAIKDKIANMKISSNPKEADAQRLQIAQDSANEFVTALHEMWTLTDSEGGGRTSGQFQSLITSVPSDIEHNRSAIGETWEAAEGRYAHPELYGKIFSQIIDAKWAPPDADMGLRPKGNILRNVGATEEQRLGYKYDPKTKRMVVLSEGEKVKPMSVFELAESGLDIWHDLNRWIGGSNFMTTAGTAKGDAFLLDSSDPVYSRVSGEFRGLVTNRSDERFNLNNVYFDEAGKQSLFGMGVEKPGKANLEAYLPSTMGLAVKQRVLNALRADASQESIVRAALASGNDGSPSMVWRPSKDGVYMEAYARTMAAGGRPGGSYLPIWDGDHKRIRYKVANIKEDADKAQAIVTLRAKLKRDINLADQQMQSVNKALEGKVPDLTSPAGRASAGMLH